RSIVETSVINFAGKGRRIVLALQILTAGEKHEGFLKSRVFFGGSRGLQSIQEESGIGEIGAIARTAVARTAIPDVGLVNFLSFVPLKLTQVSFRHLDFVVVTTVSIGGGECHHGD